MKSPAHGRRAAPRLLALGWLLAGCAQVELSTTGPSLVHATVVEASFTGWARDYCLDDAPLPLHMLRGRGNCVARGSEINDVALLGAEIVGQGRLAQWTHVGYVGHGLMNTYEKTEYFVVQPAPADFAAATGLRFLVGDRENYDAARQCIYSQGYSHLRRSDCRDPDFHQRNRGRCMPVDEYLAHYGSQN